LSYSVQYFLAGDIVVSAGGAADASAYAEIAACLDASAGVAAATAVAVASAGGG
jgi:hypothetical protein